MRQQINLFQPALVDKPEPLRGRQLRLILLLFLSLLALLSLLAYWQAYRAGQRVAGLQQQKEALEAVVSALEMRFPERQKSVLLEDEIRRSEAALGGQRQLLGYFANRSQQDNGSFLSILDGLARYRGNGVWLRRIRLVAAGDLALDGTALHPEQVPEYLQALGERQVFGGKLFSRLSLTRLDKTDGQIDFSLESLKEDMP